MQGPKVAIVGGGIAGVSLAKVLAARGVAVSLFEKGAALCSGSTWHAAGLVTRFGGSSKLKKLHVRSLPPSRLSLLPLQTLFRKQARASQQQEEKAGGSGRRNRLA